MKNKILIVYTPAKMLGNSDSTADYSGSIPRNLPVYDSYDVYNFLLVKKFDDKFLLIEVKT